jgi:protoheme IX farnesyltransferase
MVVDRDIDAKMTRTAGRPLPMGTVSAWEGTVVGLVLASSGVGWAIILSPIYAAIVFAGLFTDVVIYSIWLKRRTPWSTLWGGLAGGIPALAGRTLATGRIDTIGLLMALAVLLWIPTHIMTFSIKYAKDYARAGVPVFPNRYGERVTRLIIGASTVAAVIVMLGLTALIGPGATYLTIAAVLGVVLVSFTIASMVYATPKLNFTLYKLASLYMLGSMALIIVAR